MATLNSAFGEKKKRGGGGDFFFSFFLFLSLSLFSFLFQLVARRVTVYLHLLDSLIVPRISLGRRWAFLFFFFFLFEIVSSPVVSPRFYFYRLIYTKEKLQYWFWIQNIFFRIFFLLKFLSNRARSMFPSTLIIIIIIQRFVISLSMYEHLVRTKKKKNKTNKRRSSSFVAKKLTTISLDHLLRSADNYFHAVHMRYHLPLPSPLPTSLSSPLPLSKKSPRRTLVFVIFTVLQHCFDWDIDSSR